MKSVELRAWSRFTRRYEYDVDSGKIIRSWKAHDPSAASGFAQRCAFRMLAVYKDPRTERILLRRGRKVVPLDQPGLTARCTDRLVTSRLSLSSAEGTLLTARNFTLGRLLGLVDPGWDSLDDESEDILLWLERSIADADWAARASEGWI